MIERKKSCPKCGSLLIARNNDKIICLQSNCNWETISKRESDSFLPNFTQLKEDFNGQP